MQEQPNRPDERPDEAEVLAGSGADTPRRVSARRVSARGRAVIAATAVAALALGGTVAYAAASGGSPSPSPTSSSSSSSGPWGPGERGGHGGHGGPWARFGGDAVHGETTVKDPDSGEWVVRVWQRGTVEKTDGGRVTVKSEDGTSWTWTVGEDTPVRTDGSSESGAESESGSGAGALKKGESVFVAGSREGDTYTADRVFAGDLGKPGERDRRGPHDEGPGQGPWGRGDRSPDPSGSSGAFGGGAAT
ncbi:hypothetical protein [Streptomyces sp. Amel2xC10]|uniref:hypothetical protein n=1 Tax=Streptomyces sp. Amel2xC10 TaxID=1305826 RepID=UPI000A08D3EA|nr:hypothetical protein [Streptomyces sp. Amel2xC10]SMF45036.1 hypothetical protein SAMN02745830_03562 [Streptomyces sp. Amel2xC10]